MVRGYGKRRLGSKQSEGHIQRLENVIHAISDQIHTTGERDPYFSVNMDTHYGNRTLPV